MFIAANRKLIALGLGLAGVAVLLVPVLLGFGLPSIGAVSSNMIGVVMMLTAAGVAYGSLAFWSALALGAGAWSLVAPVLLGFYDGGTAFWTHMAAGLAWMSAGLVGHELLARERRS
jgi:hypothetical protein